MSNLIEQLNQAGTVTARGCVLKIKGDRYHMSRGASAHSIDIDSSCERRLAAHWSGFVDGCGSDDVVAVVELKPVAPVAKTAKPRKVARTYAVTFTVVGEGFTGVNDVSTEDVIATDRGDALKQGREIWRHAQGPYGLKCKMTARLKD